MVLANQNAKLTGPDQGFLVSRLVLTLKPWERGWVKMVQMVYDGRSVSDGCQMVYDGVGWLYREGLSDGEDGTDGV